MRTFARRVSVCVVQAVTFVCVAAAVDGIRERVDGADPPRPFLDAQPSDSLKLPELLPATAGEVSPESSASLLDSQAGPVDLPPSPTMGQEPLVPMITQEELQYVDVHETPTPLWFAWEAFAEGLTAPIFPMAGLFEHLTCSEHDRTNTELSPHAIGLQPLPERPPLLLELNDEFLAPGWLTQGYQMPTGVVWRPSIWVFGEYRAHYAYRENSMGLRRFSEVAESLDLFGQLNLSATERLLVGLRPMDQEVGGPMGGGQAIREFNSYDFIADDSIDGWNNEVQTLFFEGDFGEIFPNLDPYDTEYLDYGFSVGRQPLLIQDGLLINEDMIDLVSVTRNTLYGCGSLNTRATAVYAWNRLNRADPTLGNRFDPEGRMVGLFTESDFVHSTANADVAFVDSDLGSVVVWGLSAIQRLHGYHNTYNTSFHVLGSHPTNGETSIAGQGELLFGQVSWTPHCTEDLIYIDAFWAIDEFTSATRGPLQGGPLGQTGLLYAVPALGQYGPGLSNQAMNAYGGAIGYQMFFDHTRQQIIFELGARDDTEGLNNAAVGATIRFQRAIGQHWILVIDGLVSKQESVSNLNDGARVEMRAKF